MNITRYNHIVDYRPNQCFFLIHTFIYFKVNNIINYCKYKILFNMLYQLDYNYKLV